MMMCSVPRSDDSTIPGWICNPSTGYTSRFSIVTTVSSGEPVAITSCPDCVPDQVFVLGVQSGTEPTDPIIVSIDSIAVDELMDIDSVSADGRVRLLTLSSPPNLRFHSISAISDPLFPQDRVLMYILATETTDSSVTISFLYSIQLKPQLAEKFKGSIESSGSSFAVLLLFLLIFIAIVVPLAIRSSPRIQTKLRDWEWIKYKDQFGLEDDISDDAFKGVESIIGSMTPFERANPDKIDASRKKRIAAGCGRDMNEVNQFFKQFDQMKQMMKGMSNMPSMPRMGRRM
jgi:hypothetical protein